ncbi:pirin family protein [Marinomonas shanghaiensis]|uniref:pirin family protein n=1 Tax=Marinomonas shanghaiensis TaxID=2202418 RepID=UPI003A922AA0
MNSTVLNIESYDDHSDVAMQRKIVARTKGNTRGVITRLVSPSDLGQLIKPFVFLDYGVMQPSGNTSLGMHPHSGIATLSLPITGGFGYEDTTGKTGIVNAGGLEWMKAGNGVWHDGYAAGKDPLEFYQLWVALAKEEENAPAESQYIDAKDVPIVGPVTVMLGEYQGAKSLIRSAKGMNYFMVQLKDGEVWEYTPDAGQNVAWLSVFKGEVATPEVAYKGEVVVFEESTSSIRIQANGDSSFVFGAAIKHPHDLKLGYYSVHTSREALAQGEKEIEKIGNQLRLLDRI